MTNNVYMMIIIKGERDILESQINPMIYMEEATGGMALDPFYDQEEGILTFYFRRCFESIDHALEQLVRKSNEAGARIWLNFERFEPINELADGGSIYPVYEDALKRETAVVVKRFSVFFDPGMFDVGPGETRPPMPAMPDVVPDAFRVEPLVETEPIPTDLDQVR